MIYMHEAEMHARPLLPCNGNSKALALIWYRALTWYCSPARPFAAPDDPLLVTGQQGSRSPACRPAVQGSKCVRGELKPRNYQVKARYQIRANALLHAHSLSISRSKATWPRIGTGVGEESCGHEPGKVGWMTSSTRGEGMSKVSWARTRGGWDG